MTCLEKWKKDHPLEDESNVIKDKCPNDDFGMDIDDPKWCDGCHGCEECWNRELPGTIKDSGERRKFATGAVRDIQEGKGRCDLMPLDVVAWVLGNQDDSDCVLDSIHQFVTTGDIVFLYDALEYFRNSLGVDILTLFLEVAKHFEEGAKKYGEYNWQKGIPVKCYIDSAVRHYLKWLRDDKDEPHDRAFCWNILCAIWTCKHKPELNDYEENNNAD